MKGLKSELPPSSREKPRCQDQIFSCFPSVFGLNLSIFALMSTWKVIWGLNSSFTINDVSHLTLEMDFRSEPCLCGDQLWDICLTQKSKQVCFWLLSRRQNEVWTPPTPHPTPTTHSLSLEDSPFHSCTHTESINWATYCSQTCENGAKLQMSYGLSTSNGLLHPGEAWLQAKL